MTSGGEKYRWTCACCGVEFVGLPMDFAFGAPVDWTSLGWLERWRSRIDDDFCRIRYSSGEISRFIRCILPIPIPELDTEFRWGVWVSVSKDSWRIYEVGFNTGKHETEGCFGYLMHEIPGFEGSTSLHCDVRFQPDRMRPRIILYQTEHPLFSAQAEGVTKAQIEAWAALFHQKPQ
jgi:hypothetical protein